MTHASASYQQEMPSSRLETPSERQRLQRRWPAKLTTTGLLRCPRTCADTTFCRAQTMPPPQTWAAESRYSLTPT